jgi:hypothetical protein
MAMTIVPGYDFTVNETPMQSTLYQMIAGATLSGIPLSQIDTSLIGIKLGDSDVSLPSEGWLWKDELGCLWVKSRWGNIRIFRGSYGGQETNRYQRGANTRAPFYEPVNMVEPGFRIVYDNTVPGGANDTTPSSVRLRNDWPVLADKCPYKQLETAVSDAHVRVNLWGFVPLPVSIHAHNFPGLLTFTNTHTYTVGSYPWSHNSKTFGLLLRNLSTPSASTMKWAWGYTPGTPFRRF